MLPFVSIIVPCRNEREFIAACLESIVANDYPASRREVLIVDGMSSDGTREIAGEYARRCPGVRRLDNPRVTTPCALNIGIREARGEFILWMSAHSVYAPDYVRRAVAGAVEFDADNVGGVIVPVPRDDSFLGRCVTRSISHPFGVGNSFFRVPAAGPRWVDTVFGGCYRRSVFDRVGLFNERLVRGQDMEFNLRLKRAGGRILLLPTIKSYYHARSEIGAFCAHNWRNGVWAILPFVYSDAVPVRARHLVPLAFVSALGGTLLLALAAPPLGWAAAAIAVLYLAVSLAASCRIAWRERDPRYVVVMPLVFAILHVGYGLGSVWGVLRALATREGRAKLAALVASPLRVRRSRSASP